MTRHWLTSQALTTRTQGPRNASSFQLAPPRLPMFQKVRSRSWASVAMNVSTPIRLNAIAVIATPASSRPATPGTRRPTA
ncbi:hypothetical protein D3C72_2133660 [compost metagenome]